MSRRDLRVEVSEQSRDWGLSEVTQDGTLAARRGVGALKGKDVFLDQVTKILLFQPNLNPQRFELVLHERQVVASVLTPSGYPGDLTLNCLELILNNVRNVITFLLKVFSKPIPPEKSSAYLSHAMEGPMIIRITVLIMLSRLRRSHKPISNTS